MDSSEEKKRKRKAAIITIGFHIITVILFLLFGLTQPVPLPDDAGASIEFGWDEAASGDAVATLEDNPPTPQETSAPVEPEEVLEETPEEDVVTAEESEVSVPKVKEEKPKVEKKPEPIKEPEPSLSNELSKALESLSSPSGGGSQGDKTGTGDQGNPQGTKGKGALGGGSGSWQLDGRSMLPGYGTKITDTREEGIVVLNITVDRNGKVTAVSPNLKESNTTSQYLINLAKNDVLNNFKFNGDPSAAIEQRGKVRYVFKLD